MVSCPVLVGDEAIGDLKISGIKVDVEGFEIRVLEGFRKTLRRDRPWLLTEILAVHLARDGRNLADFDKILRAIDYTPMRIGLTGQKFTPKRLALEPCDDLVTEGDILWMPSERIEEVSVFITARTT